jgi:hypothetical protein
MDKRTAQRQAEERAIRTKMAELHQELDALQVRLQALGRPGDQPASPRQVHLAFRLGASPPREAPEPAPVITLPSVPREPMDPLERLAQAARGTFFFAPGPGEEPDPPVSLWLRADARPGAERAAAPDMEFRAAVFTGRESGVVLVVVLMRLGPEEPENLHEAWLDASEEETAGVLKALVTQEALAVRLYGDGCRLGQVVQVPNPLQALAARARQLSTGVRPWSADAFHALRTAVFQQYPTVRVLWRALKA